MKTYLYLGIGIALGLAAILLVWQLSSRNYTFQGSLIDPPAPAADFELVDQDGNPYRLSDQQGKVVLIFFGYTHCPDVCPVTLSEFRQVKQRLGELADQVEFVFVTVDPERDSPAALKSLLANFDPAFVGLTGEQQVLDQVYQHYGVYAEKQETGSLAGYLVDHTSRIYLIDRQGNWRLTYPFGFEPDKLAKDVAFLVKEKMSK